MKTKHLIIFSTLFLLLTFFWLGCKSTEEKTTKKYPNDPIILQDKNNIRIDGFLHLSSALRIIIPLFNAYTSGENRVRLTINSKGGNVLSTGLLSLGFSIARLFNIETEVEVRESDECLSYCFFLFMKSDRRFAAASAMFMAHAPFSVGGDEQFLAKKIFAYRYIYIVRAASPILAKAIEESGFWSDRNCYLTGDALATLRVSTLIQSKGNNENTGWAMSQDDSSNSNLITCVDDRSKIKR